MTMLIFMPPSTACWNIWTAEAEGAYSTTSLVSKLFHKDASCSWILKQAICLYLMHHKCLVFRTMFIYCAYSMYFEEITLKFVQYINKPVKQKLKELFILYI